jgi:hypothetical protein
MTKTKSKLRSQIRLLFGSFEFWSFNIVSNFGFRDSNLKPFQFILQSNETMPWPEDQIFGTITKSGCLCHQAVLDLFNVLGGIMAEFHRLLEFV